MPLFVLHALDRPGALALRLEHDAAHRAFMDDLARFGLSLVLSGPLQSDDGAQMTGSLLIFEAPDRAAVEAFAAADPFGTQGVWGEIKITRFHRRFG